MLEGIGIAALIAGCFPGYAGAIIGTLASKNGRIRKAPQNGPINFKYHLFAYNLPSIKHAAITNPATPTNTHKSLPFCLNFLIANHACPKRYFKFSSEATCVHHK
jgi:hypothetical protein